MATIVKLTDPSMCSIDQCEKLHFQAKCCAVYHILFSWLPSYTKIGGILPTNSYYGNHGKIDERLHIEYWSVRGTALELAG